MFALFSEKKKDKKQNKTKKANSRWADNYRHPRLK